MLSLTRSMEMNCKRSRRSISGTILVEEIIQLDPLEAPAAAERGRGHGAQLHSQTLEAVAETSQVLGKRLLMIISEHNLQYQFIGAVMALKGKEVMWTAIITTTGKELNSTSISTRPNLIKFFIFQTTQ